MEVAIEGVDFTSLAAWMDAQDLGTGGLEHIEVLGGGTQNVLVRFERAGRSYVLRRPPLHKRSNSDETMRREARVLAALRGTGVPHPGLIAACADEAVLGAAFYLMEPIEGFNATVALPTLHAADARMRHAMGLALVDAAAALGRVDHIAVGLSDFGKAEGFLARQVERWRSQLDGYASLPGYGTPQLPGVDRVAQWLEAHRPSTFTPGILHGDLHFANVLFRFDGPGVAALVDWELATIGDPLLDLGWLLATWPDPERGDEMAIAPVDATGLPTADELVARYAEGSSRDLRAMPWYAVLACYKLGIILEGTHARAGAGKADPAIGDALHATAVGLFRRAARFIDAA